MIACLAECYLSQSTVSRVLLCLGDPHLLWALVSSGEEVIIIVLALSRLCFSLVLESCFFFYFFVCCCNTGYELFDVVF